MAIEEVLSVTSKSDDGGIKDATKSVDKMDKSVETLGKSSKKAFDGIVSTLKKIPSVGTSVFNGIKNAGIGAFNGIKGAISALPAALGVFNQAAEGLGQIRDMFSGLFEQMKAASPEFSQAFLGLQDSIQQITGPLFEKLANAFVPILEKLMYVMRDPAVQELINKIGDLLVKAIDQVVVFIDTVLIPAINVIVPILTDVLNGDWEAAWNKMLDFVRNIDWQGLLNGAIDAIKGVWGGVKDIMSAPFVSAVSTVMMILLIIEKALTDVVNSIVDAVNGVVGGVNDAIKGINYNLGTQIGLIGLIPRIKPRAVSIGTNGGFAVGLAEGGIAMKPTLAVVGDAPSPEVVAPLDKLKDMLGGTGITVNVYGPFGAGYTPAQAGAEAGNALINQVRAKGYRV